MAEVIQVVVPNFMRPALEQWLKLRGFVLFRMPDFEDDLPTYGIGPIPEEEEPKP